jgi:SagB-type dehydrogenase family enzyme
VYALAYHETTKHHFHRFAKSLGYLDWATQPNPFRRYAGAPELELPRAPLATGVPYAALFDDRSSVVPIDLHSIGELLRCSMGLSAWKQHQRSRWSLRVNPSSGNLHPTEAHVLWSGRVCHYAPFEHLLEERCRLPDDIWVEWAGERPVFLLALTSITWREAWKYGERAFRYCQHDVGHAIGALRLAAAMLGWRLTLLPRWADDDIAAMLNLTIPDDDGVEREEPECMAVITPEATDRWRDRDPAPLVSAARRARWQGTPNQLSASHVQWEVIDRVVVATRYPGDESPPQLPVSAPAAPTTSAWLLPARDLLLQRRSALAFDARSRLTREALAMMLDRLQPRRLSPWDAIDWSPQVHLAMFVHRVEGLVPGIYAYLRDRRVIDEWKTSLRTEFLWEPVAGFGEPTSLFLLLPMDVAFAANRVSCDQEIAADGFFSLGMIARFEPSLRERGESFYRRLFWECGLIGQVLYLEAEAAGARSTGIGCFYDDAVHEMLGLTGTAWQSLYHFSMGMPVDDTRLLTEPGYAWEARGTKDTTTP